MEVVAMSEYNVVIGLEIHVELDTKTKAFCSCRNEFGAMPNTQVCPVCLGLPGALPVLNRKAVEYTIMGGLSFGSEINNRAVFERKNYFYPDLAKSYQVTQLNNPLCVGGGIRLSTGKFIKFNRIHLEEDSAKLIHNNDTNKTLIDFNRSGIPLIEMVTDPAIMTAEEVVDFLNKLKSTLVYSGIARCRMEEGGLRFDLNLSVSNDKEVLGTRCEINNLGSLKSVEKAIEYESARHIALIESGREVLRETRGWDEEKGETYSLRKKEVEKDYRYFPDPDIIPVSISPKDIQRLKRRLPEIIDSRRIKLKDWGIKDSDIDTLFRDKNLLDYYLELVNITHEPIESVNWVLQDLRHEMNKNNVSPYDVISVSNLSEIIKNVMSGDITRVNAKVLFVEVITTSKDAEVLIREMDLMGEVNKKDIVDLMGMLINANPNIIKDYKIYPEQVMNFFIGNILKNTQGKAKVEHIEPLVSEILKNYK